MAGERPLGGLLLLGLLCAPAVFCWLILRRGYDQSLRRTVFAYTAILTTIGIAGRLG